MLHLVSIEGQVKASFAAILTANIALPQSSWAVAGNAFCY